MGRRPIRLQLVAIALATDACLTSVAIQAAPASGFCRELTAVLAQAGDGFATFRGTEVRTIPDDGGGDDGIRYAASRRLPGAVDCGVDRAHSDGEDVLTTYVCWFHPLPTPTAALTRINADIVGCIGVASDDRIAVASRGKTATADIQRKGYVISLNADEDHPVVLEISGK